MIIIAHRTRIARSVIVGIFIMIFSGFAQETLDLSTKAKIDSIYRMVKEQHVQRNPLNDKNNGIEINPVRFLFLTEYTSFSGTFSLFNVNRHAEIAFPIFYGSEKQSKGTSEFDLDCHYRYFLGSNQKGFYLSAFVRYSYLHGYRYDYGFYDYYYNPSESYQTISTSRLGLGMGLGVRIFSKNGLYWGTGMIVGRYIDNGYDLSNSSLSGLSGSLTSLTPYILEFELLKIGWAF